MDRKEDVFIVLYATTAVMILCSIFMNSASLFIVFSTIAIMEMIIYNREKVKNRHLDEQGDVRKKTKDNKQVTDVERKISEKREAETEQILLSIVRDYSWQERAGRAVVVGYTLLIDLADRVGYSFAPIDDPRNYGSRYSLHGSVLGMPLYCDLKIEGRKFYVVEEKTIERKERIGRIIARANENEKEH